MSIDLFRFLPDNVVVARRMAARASGKSVSPRVLNSLGDYPASLPNQVIVTTGLEERGPRTAPTELPPASMDPTQILADIRDLLGRMPAALSDEFRTRFVIQPRESVPFAVPAGPVTVAPAASVAIVQVQISERYCGYLTGVGIGGASPTLANVRWQIRISNAVSPKFNNIVFAVSNLATPLPFTMEITQNSLVQLVAANGNAGPVDLSGVLVGWTEFMSTNKSYGASPASGIG